MPQPLLTARIHGHNFQCNYESVEVKLLAGGQRENLGVFSMAAAQQSGWRALRAIISGAFLATLLVGRPNLGSADDGPWLTGEPLHSALSQKVTVVWSNIPVRQALEGLCKSQKVAILLDRRIDPDRKIEFSLDDLPLSDGFQQIASRLGVGTTLLGAVAYFGPVATAGRLPAVAALRRQDVEKLPPASRARWTQPHPWKWDDLAAPRDLSTALAQEAGVTVRNPELVPADLWAHADLPPLTLPERLTLLLAQFDLTYELSADGKSLRLIPIPENLPQQSVAELPIEKSAAEKPGHRVVVGEARKVYSLQVELPVGQLLKSLGPRMGLEIRVDQAAVAAAGKSLDTKVKLDVKDVGDDELLHAVLDPAGLTFTRQQNVVDVQPKP